MKYFKLDLFPTAGQRAPPMSLRSTEYYILILTYIYISNFTSMYYALRCLTPWEVDF